MVELLSKLEQEIEERRRAEDNLRRTTTELRFLNDLVEQAPQPFRVSDLQGRLVRFNRAFEQLTGYRGDELRNMNFRQLAPERWHALEEQQIAHLLATGKAVRYEKEYRRKDGTVVPLELVVDLYRNAAGEPEFIYAFLTDITERKRAEAALAEERNLLRALIDNLPDYIYVKDAESRYILDNRAHRRLVGARSPEEIRGKTVFDFYEKDLAARYYADDQAVITSDQPLVNSVEPDINPAGEMRWHATTKMPLRDGQGKIVGLVGIARDITEQKRAEEALTESERRYRQLTEAALDAIVVADQTGRITLFNPAAERMFGYAAAEILGQPLTELMPPPYRPRHDQGFQHYLTTHQARIVGRTVELVGLRKDGTEFPLELSLSALDLGGESQFLGAIRDLTERERLRAAMMQSEKLASIGLLSAGVAHEINNPLAFVANNLVVLERDTQGLLAILELYEGARGRLAEVDPEAARRLGSLAEEFDLPYVRANLGRVLTRTREGVVRVTRIVQSLRGLARTDPPQLEAAHLPDLVEMSLEMIRGRLRRREIAVELDHGPIPKVRCVSTQIGQVLLNLLVNAMQAIEATDRPTGGRIRIATRQVGDEVLVEVADNGCGIAPEDLPRIFDPFFTTKPVGEGMGLGLSLTHSIVTGHGGRIEVTSRPGEGSCFRIFLPIDPKQRGSA